MEKNYKELLNGITTFVFDMDGVLSDGAVWLHPGTEPVRRLHSKDGYALQKAVKEGYRVALISGGRSEGVAQRLKHLGITDIYMGIADKMEAYRDLVAIYDLNPAAMAYMGDDLPDMEVMTRVGLAAAPQDAAPEIKAISHYVSPLPGGHGCVRDLIEQTLKVQGRWMNGNHHW
jgi:3-deoxy-D-manno-octulosonate 8-phosphate phosphatase (KDO 8-P phosphatase)